MALTPAEAVARVLAVAYAFENLTEVPPGSNRGQVVDWFQTWLGLSPQEANPWCACFVGYAGWHGLYDPVAKKSAWPMPRSAALAGCAALGEFAQLNHVLVREPQPGDLFLLYYPKLRRFAHTGIVVAPAGLLGSWRTLEGNTSKPGDTDPKTQREGWGIFERTRTFGENDRFVRWTQLLDDPVAHVVQKMAA